MSKFYLAAVFAVSVTIAGCSSGVSTQADSSDVSINEAGQVDPNASTVDDNSAAENNTSDSPQIPMGLKGVVYTDTRTALFWDKSADASVVNYRIKRDGVLMTTSDALNYYDNSVVAGTTYEYSVESIDNNGLFSVAASLFLTTPEAAPTINLTNARSILEHVILASNGGLFSDLLSKGIHLINSANEVDLLSNGFIKLSQEDDDTGATTSLYGCDMGGQYSVIDKYFYDAPPPSRKQSMQLIDCFSTFFADANLNGDFILDVVMHEPRYDIGHITNVEFDGFSNTDSKGGTQVMSGEYSSYSGDKRFFYLGQSYQYFKYENSARAELFPVPVPFSYLSSAFEGDTIVSDMFMDRTRGWYRQYSDPNEPLDWNNDLKLKFSIQSPTTGNKQLNVTTPERFDASREGDCFATGQLKITAEDGSELILDADSGVAESVLLTVTSDGISTEQTLPWSVSLALLHATPEDVVDSAPAVPVHSDCNVGS